VRRVPLHLRTLDEPNRRSEAEFLQAFHADLPRIFRGLLDYIAKILVHLPSVEVTNPECMYDFVRWLAAMEMVDDAPTSVYQAQYPSPTSARPVSAVRFRLGRFGPATR